MVLHRTSVSRSQSLTPLLSVFFFFNDPATTEIYTLSLHDALPISEPAGRHHHRSAPERAALRHAAQHQDRKSTRLNSSHSQISYAVFCLKKKTNVGLSHSLDQCHVCRTTQASQNARSH